MTYQSKSIRTFIGAKNFAESRAFYTALGFEEHIIDKKMSLFKVNDTLAFYLQDYYLKKWIENSMIFLEVDNVEKCEAEIAAKDLTKTFKSVRFTDIKGAKLGARIFYARPFWSALAFWRI